MNCPPSQAGPTSCLSTTAGARTMDDPPPLCLRMGGKAVRVGAILECVFIHLKLVVGVYKYIMKSRDVIKALKSDGWEQVAQKGSHVQFKHPTKKGRVTVPHPKKDIPTGTLRSVEKQADLKLK